MTYFRWEAGDADFDVLITCATEMNTGQDIAAFAQALKGAL